MPVTIQQVRAVLDPEEPDYIQAAQLGSDALPHIENLLKGADPMLASKAAYLASLIQDNRSITVLKEAAQSNYSAVRVAAAAGARNLALLAASDVLLGLLEDQDVGVRKVALKSAPVDAPPALRAKIQKLTNTDPEKFVRDLSSQVFGRLRTKP